MRDLIVSDRNELCIKDGRSGSDLVLYYRTPTTKEEAAYNSKMVVKKGRKIQLNLHATRLTFGLRILTGFRDGDFCFEGKPISSDPVSEDYNPDWKNIVYKGGSDIVAVLGRTVFEGVRVDEDVDIEEEGGEIDIGSTSDDLEEKGEEASPLVKS